MKRVVQSELDKTDRKAIKQLLTALSIHKKKGHLPGIASVCLHIGDFHMERGHLKTAERFFLEGRNAAFLGEVTLMPLFFKMTGRLYKKMGWSEKAREHRLLAARLRRMFRKKRAQL